MGDMRIASYNVESLFDRAKAMNPHDWEAGKKALEDYARVNELLGERATNRSVVWAEGPSPLARVLTGVAFGDLVSVYLAILYQTDTTPVTLLAMLKQRLARSTD